MKVYNSEKEKYVSKIMHYLAILIHVPLVFLNDDIILNIPFLKEFADLMANYFVGVESFALAGERIGYGYYTIKFIYSYLFISAPIIFIMHFYTQVNIYMYNLGLIKKTFFNIDNCAIKAKGSAAPFFLLIFILFFLFIPIYFYSQNYVDTSLRASIAYLISTKFGAIFLVFSNSLILGIMPCIILIEFIAKIYSRNFRIILTKEEKKAFKKAFAPIITKKGIREFIYFCLSLFMIGILFFYLK